jgi:TP901 family phage tail tape measure protein
MPDLILRFRVMNDGQAKAALRGAQSAAKQAGRALDHAGRSGRRGAQETARAWSAAGRPLRSTERLAQQVARAQARAAKKGADAAIREGDRRVKAIARFMEKIKRDELRRIRDVERAEKASAKNRERVAKRLAKVRERRRDELQSIAGGAIGAVGRTALRGARLAVGGAALIGGAALRTRFNNEDAARKLARKGGGSVSGAQLLEEAEGTARSVRGTRSADVLKAQNAFVTKTGDLDAARRFSKTFAEISLATDTAADEIGGAAADLFQKFDIKTIKDMEQAMATLAVQGKRGAFELEDAARLFPRVLAAARRFGVEGNAKGLAQIGGFTQLARQSTGSGEEAATAVENVFSQLAKKSGVLKRAGVQVFDKNNRGRDFRDVISETIAATGGDQGKLNKIFGQRGIRAVSPLIQTFNDTKESAVGTEAERTAEAMRRVREQFDLAADATGAVAEIQLDLANAQKDNSTQVSAAWEELMSTMGKSLAPLAKQLIAGIKGIDFKALAESAGKATKAFIEIADALGIINGGPEHDKNEKNGFGNEGTKEKRGRKARALASQIRGRAANEKRDLTDEEKAQVEQLDVVAQNAPSLPPGASPTQVAPPDAASLPINEAEFERVERPSDGDGGGSGDAIGAIADLQSKLADLGFGKVKGKTDAVTAALGKLMTAAGEATDMIREMGGAARTFKENEGS